MRNIIHSQPRDEDRWMWMAKPALARDRLPIPTASRLHWTLAMKPAKP